MPAFWITGAPPQPKRPNMALLRTIKDVRKALGHGDLTLFASQTVLRDLLTGPQCLGESEDQSVLEGAQIALESLGCGTFIGDDPGDSLAPGTPAVHVDKDEGTGYSSAQIALVQLAHVNGNPQLAASGVKMQENVLRSAGEDESADIFADALSLLVDTFSNEQEGTTP